MYLHIGLDVMIENKKVIGIFDLQTVKKDFLQKFTNKESDLDNYVSCVLTSEGIFFAEISSTTLQKRAENLFKKENTYV